MPAKTLNIIIYKPKHLQSIFVNWGYNFSRSRPKFCKRRLKLANFFLCFRKLSFHSSENWVDQAASPGPRCPRCASRNRKFESISLQQRVECETDFSPSTAAGAVDTFKRITARTGPHDRGNLLRQNQDGLDRESGEQARQKGRQTVPSRRWATAADRNSPMPRRAGPRRLATGSVPIPPPSRRLAGCRTCWCRTTPRSHRIRPQLSLPSRT